MKKISLFLGLFSLILAGCANTQGLTEDEQREAAIKYPMMWANLQPDDGGVAVTAKIITRVLLFPLTIGLSELEFLEDRNKTFSQYADYLNTKYYYDGFLGKNKSHALMQLGAPTRTCIPTPGIARRTLPTTRPLKESSAMCSRLKRARF